MHKKTITAITLIWLGVSFAKAAEVPAIAFDGDFAVSPSFADALMDARLNQNDKIVCEEARLEGPSPARVQLFSQEAPSKKPASKQPLIKRLLSDYNNQILRSANIEKNLKTPGTVIAFKLPGEILITKNGETLATIKDAALLETIRISLLESDRTERQLMGKCLECGVRQVWVYVQGVLVEKAVKVCLEYAEDIVNNPPPQEITPHPYPQAPGYSSGCYTQPNGQVVCE